MNMQKPVIGYIFSGRNLSKDEEILLRVAKKRDIQLVLFNISKPINLKELEEKVKQCDIIYNSTAVDFAIEFKKTIEELGRKVVEPSEAYYFTEDKWLFFLKCKESKIPTPDTILLSGNLNIAKKQLKKFDRWPVVIKRVYGTMGEYVGKADNLEQGVKIIRRFWKKGSERLPIIAQEFIPSPSYRVTVIGEKIVQTAIKENKGWKATGNYAKNFKKFDVDKDLGRIVKRIMKMSKMKIFGIDLVKRDDHWLVLEVNSEPALDFFEDEREKLIEEVLDFMEKDAYD